MIKKLAIPKIVFLPFFFKSQQPFLLLLLISISQFINAQNFQNGPALNLAFENIGVEEGLDAGKNRYIKKDSKGLVWIGSSDGLFQFDGINLKKFESKSDDSTSILDDFIQSDFYEDSEGDIWFTTVKGINTYRRNKNEFERIQIYDENNNLLDFDYHIFYLENDKYLWLTIEGAIYKYNIDSKKTLKIGETKGIDFEVEVNSLNEVVKIFACPMILESGFEVLSKNNNGAFERKVFWANGYNKSFIDVRGGLIQSDSSIWFFSKSGLIHFNALTEKSTLIKLPGGIGNGLESGVLINENHILGGGISGLWIYNISEKKFAKHFCKNENKPKGWKQDSVEEIYLDEDDQLWVSFKDESRISFSWIYQLPFLRSFENTVKGRVAVASIVEDKKQNIWALGEDHHIYKMNSKGELIGTQHSIPKLKNESRETCISGTEEGEVFMLLSNEVFRYEEESAQWKSIYDFGANKILFFDAISNNRVMAITEKGVLDLQKNRMDLWEGIVHDLPINAVETFQFYPIGDSLFLMPVANKSIEVYSIRKETFQLIQKVPAKIETFSVFKSTKEDVFWLGTNEGVKQLVENNGEYKLINKIEGIEYDGFVNNVIEDDHAGLWFTSLEGLFFYDLETKNEIKYSTEDGLPDNNFINHYSSLKAENGRMWFGTQNGSVSFFSKEIIPFDKMPVSSIESVEVNNIPVPLPENKLLQLKYYENTISVELKSIGTHLPKKNKLFYRVTGYENNWIEIKSGEKIRFNKMNAGKYQFEYFVRNGNGIDGEIKEFVFDIEIPFWKKWWFYTACLLGFLSLIFILARVYVNRKLRQQQRLIEKQQALQEERNRIASELHDDLGSGLSIIKFLSDDINDENPRDIKFENILRINHSAKDLLEKMGDIIWAMNTSNDTLEDLIIHLYQYTYQYLDTYQIETELKIPESIPVVEISGAKRRNILLVVKEILHNIVKHAKANEVEFIVLIKMKKLCISIKDNGVGFKAEVSTNSGNGLKNMKKRIHDLNGEIQFVQDKGTCVILNVPIDSTKVI